MGNYVMEKAPEGGVFVHCQGIIGNSAQIQRGEGIANTIEKDSKWTKAADVPCDWDASKAVNTVDDYLAQYGDDLKAVISIMTICLPQLRLSVTQKAVPISFVSVLMETRDRCR